MIPYTQPLSVCRHPNERVAPVRFAVDRPVTTTLEIDDGRPRRTVTFDADHDPAAGLPAIGMRADTEHASTVAAHGATAPARLACRTPPP